MNFKKLMILAVIFLFQIGCSVSSQNINNNEMANSSVSNSKQFNEDINEENQKIEKEKKVVKVFLEIIKVREEMALLLIKNKVLPDDTENEINIKSEKDIKINEANYKEIELLIAGLKDYKSILILTKIARAYYLHFNESVYQGVFLDSFKYLAKNFRDNKYVMEELKKIRDNSELEDTESEIDQYLKGNFDENKRIED